MCGVSSKRSWADWALAALSGLLLAASRPPVDIGWLALVGLVPLVLAVRGQRPRRAALLGLLAGVVYYAIVVSWTWYFGAVAIVPLVLVLAAYWSAATAVVAALARRGLAHPAITAVVWVCAEGAVARWPLGGFSWGELGYAMHDIAPVRSVAAIGGLPLVSFVVVVANAILAEIVVAARARKTRQLIAPIAGLVALVVGVGAWFAAWPRQPATGRLHVALIQGNNIDRYLTDAELEARYIPAQNFALADRLHGHYDLVVFPESSMDTSPIGDPYLESHIRATAARLHSYVLANGPEDLANGKDANLDVLYAPDGKVVGTYSKRHLVPFGEYVPFGSVLRPLIPALKQIPVNFEPGKHPGLMTVAGHRVATVICFESAFGYQVRPLVRDGAQLIVLSTNNRSYQRSANSEQHVAISQLRAAETGRAVLHSAVSGETAVVDDRGTLLSHTSLFHNGTVSTFVTTRRGETLYVRFGEWVLQLCLLALVVLVGIALWRGRRDRRVTEIAEDAPAAEPVGESVTVHS
jgi:apolipoprotein N-acyltransferase